MHSSPTYKAYSLHNFREIKQLSKLSETALQEIEVVAQVFPFKVNNYVIENLINWNNVPNDPIFILTFPQKEMLRSHQYQAVKEAMNKPAQLKEIVYNIRMELNPHPAKQMEMNVPSIDGHKLAGMQHKYRETVLFFPSQGQTCHAYCTFCFRWPQFVGISELKFSMNEPDLLVRYLQEHPYVTDLIITGGDPLMMKTKVLATYIKPILAAKLPNLKAIRIGSKTLSYWPARYLTDDDADDLFQLFKEIKASGIHLALMAHFNHPAELSTPEVKKAIKKLIKASIQIRTQSPLIKRINDSADIWAELWKQQVTLGLIPYYMFVERDTGAQHYFAVPLVKSWEIFKDALQKVSGICRTVRGPSMSCTPGKVEVVGVGNVNGENVITLRMIQSRNPDWVLKPFFAEYSENATWIDQLTPAFGDKEFFFEKDLNESFHTFISDH